MVGDSDIDASFDVYLKKVSYREVRLENGGDCKAPKKRDTVAV